MTVAELIEFLSKFPSETPIKVWTRTPVKVWDYDAGDYKEVIGAVFGEDGVLFFQD